MNFLLTLVIIVTSCLAISNCEGKSQLESDFDEILILLPDQKIKGIIFKYVLFDKEVFELFVFFQGEEFKRAWRDSFELSTVRKLLDYMDSEGVDAYGKINSIARDLGLPMIQKRSQYLKKVKGINGLIEEISQSLPHETIQIKLKEKLQKSSAFQNFHRTVGEMDIKEISQFAQNSMEVTKILNYLRDREVDIDSMFAALKSFFKWT